MLNLSTRLSVIQTLSLGPPRGKKKTPPSPLPLCTRKKQKNKKTQTVQNLIERCLQLYMSQREAVFTLQARSRVDPGFTALVWAKLEEQNAEFFRAYYTRLKLKDQVVLFNHLLEQQVAMAARVQQQEQEQQEVGAGGGGGTGSGGGGPPGGRGAWGGGGGGGGGGGPGGGGGGGRRRRRRRRGRAGLGGRGWSGSASRFRRRRRLSGLPLLSALAGRRAHRAPVFGDGGGGSSGGGGGNRGGQRKRPPAAAAAALRRRRRQRRGGRPPPTLELGAVPPGPRGRPGRAEPLRREEGRAGAGVGGGGDGGRRGGGGRRCCGGRLRLRRRRAFLRRCWRCSCMRRGRRGSGGGCQAELFYVRSRL